MEGLQEHIDHLVGSKLGVAILGPMTQYTIWLIISVLITAIVLIVVSRRVSLIPKGFFTGGIEAMFGFLRKDMGEGVLGRDGDKHMPFLFTIFFFILVSNLIGLIPGVFVATGAIGTTLALALVSFVYFNYYGFKSKGFVKYMVSFAPKGVVLPLQIFIWFLELVGVILRLVTLAVRLFGNMYAGHLVLGTFALLTSVAMSAFFQSPELSTFLSGLPGILWMVFLIVMYFMELFVAVLQAYVFSMLSATYIQLATADEH